VTASHEFMGSTRAIVAPGEASTRLAEEAATRDVVWAVIADRGFAESGALDPLLAGLAPEWFAIVGLVNEDPGLEDVEELWIRSTEHKAGGVIAIGGGSALCAGKAVAIRQTNPAPLVQYRGRDRLLRPPSPCIAVPTTGGSGSEVSEVVVLHEPNDGPQIVIRGRGYAPVVAILDGELLASLPRRPMILAALDAFSHAYESLWSTSSTSFTDALALSAARRLRKALPLALDGDATARQELVEASAMANYACGNAELATVHALSSAPVVHLPHGYQTGILMAHVADWMAPALTPEAAEEISHLEGCFQVIGFDPHFKASELDQAHRDAMVKAALESPLLANDPLTPDADQLARIVDRACLPK
jgi:alcohol dehydrogenase class IV